MLTRVLALAALVATTAAAADKHPQVIGGQLDTAGQVPFIVQVNLSRSNEQIEGPPSSNAIQYSWELPPSSTDGVASGISNAQGWAFSTAGSITSVALKRDGQHFVTLPCCSERGDVHNAVPGAPLLTGFSAAIDWGNLGNGPSDLTLVIRDSAGNEKRETRTIQSVQILNGVPFAQDLLFTQATVCKLTNGSGGAMVSLSNLSFAQAICTGDISFAWLNGKQTLEVVGGCH